MTEPVRTDAPPEQTYHQREIDDVLQLLDSTADGLSASTSADRLQQHGPNRLPEPRRRGPLKRFFSQFHNVLIYVLLAAALLTALLGHLIDTVVILAVVLVNTILGFIQEGKAERAIAAIREMLSPTANVLRDGERREVPGEELVPGDIVLLEAGDRVPADLRLIKAHGLAAQEAILTGESVPVEKGLQAVAVDAALGDRQCMAFSGTLISAGQGRGVVTATGSDTEIGRISHLLADVETLTTPLVRQMAVFSRWLTFVILALAGLIMAWGGLVRQMPFEELFVAVVGLSVAAIPEGLPAVLTVVLAIGVQTMARRNAIVRRLPSIETLGSVSVICSDKTGTLTLNEMMVASVQIGDQCISVKGEGYAPEGEFEPDSDALKPALETMARVALLCNDAELRQKDGNWYVQGDPMEGALLALAARAGLEDDKERRQWQRIDTIPFDAAHRFMATLHRHPEQGVIALVKGAPERILEMCRDQSAQGGKTEQLDSEHWQQRTREIADRGQRVLALAMRRMPEGSESLSVDDVEGELTLLGLVGLIDPPRPEAVEAVADCQRAGIRVKMITGDHSGTAAAIARQIGLEHPDNILTGADIDTMDDEALNDAVMDTDVFARTSPEHKLRLVKALQARGLVVAMTGDGVNDAPALKRADAGIAMGRKGTEAAREASELVLADDNFASIAAAVSAGRTVYDNLKKVITFLLPINGGESLSLIIAILLGLTLPISPVQILWVNMVSSVLLALTLAFEPPERQVMQRPPRPAGTPIVTGLIIWRILFVSLIFTIGVFGQFLLAQSQGLSLEASRTMTVNTLVVMEIFYLFSVRYTYGSSLTLQGIKGTPAVLMAVAGVTLLQLMFTYTPFMHTFFSAEPLTLQQGMQVIAFGVLVLIILETEKWVVRRLKKQF